MVIRQDRTRVSTQPKMDCVADAVSLIKSMNAERWVGFNDGNLGYMSHVKQLARKIPLFWNRGKNTNVNEDIRIARKQGFQSLVLHHEGITPAKVQMIRSAGLEVGAWTVNDRGTMKRLLDIGVQRIYTDHPRLLFSLKAER